MSIGKYRQNINIIYPYLSYCSFSPPETLMIATRSESYISSAPLFQKQILTFYDINILHFMTFQIYFHLYNLVFDICCCNYTVFIIFDVVIHFCMFGDIFYYFVKIKCCLGASNDFFFLLLTITSHKPFCILRFCNSPQYRQNLIYTHTCTHMHSNSKKA